MNTPFAESAADQTEHAYAFSAEIQTEMLKRKGPKYRLFLAGMEASIQTAKIVFLGNHGKARGEFLRFFYAVMRYVDDIVDGDRPLPAEFDSTEAFVQSLINILKSPEPNPTNDIETLLLHCMNVGKTFDQDMSEEAICILRSLLFDAKRIGGTQTFPQDELYAYFYDLDIQGTVEACLKLYDEDLDLKKEIEDLAYATRIHYNLRDFDEDVRAGLINIPQEDMTRLNITVEDLKNGTSNENILRWFAEQSNLGLELLRKHRLKIHTIPLKHRTTRIILHFAYERGAENYFREMLELQKLGFMDTIKRRLREKTQALLGVKE